MNFNRFDICESYYLFLSSMYEGLGSKSYQRLCRMQEYFKPGVGLSIESCSPEVYAGFVELCQRHEADRILDGLSQPG